MAASPHSPEYRALRQRLRDARRHAGLTQSEVAEKLGKYQSFISKVETGERRLDPVELAQLARLYGVEPAALLPPAPGKRRES